MKYLVPKIGLSLGVVALTAVTAASATASTTSFRAAHTPAWHPILTLKNASTPASYAAFDAVVATGQRSGWAFLPDGGGKTTTAYQRTGTTTWRKVPFPGQVKDGYVSAATGEKGGPVFVGYATGQKSDLYEWTGTRWRLLYTAPGQITGLSELNADDLWMFGSSTGVMHWTGSGWVHEINSAQGGYALSDSDVWAYYGQTITHFNGKTWTPVNVKKLLPPVTAGSLGHVTPYVTGIIALSPADVYATGEGTESPHGGPLALLHYNGHAWSRVAMPENSTSPLEQSLVPDGKGGLWMAAGDGAGNPALFHYTAAGDTVAGKLTRVPLPGGDTFVFPGASVLSRIPGTAEVLAAGVGYNTSNNKQSPVILEYS